MIGKVFVSYRRQDSLSATHRMCDHLRASGLTDKDGLFLDIDSIRPGSDFRDVITSTLQVAEAVVVVIGPGWLDARRFDGGRRLDSPSDTHRLEIAEALRSDATVVPVRVEGAPHPGFDDLPSDIADLAFLNSWELSERRFVDDVGGLSKHLAEICAQVRLARAETEKARLQAEQAQAEKARLQAEQAQAEKARLQAEQAETERREVSGSPTLVGAVEVEDAGGRRARPLDTASGDVQSTPVPAESGEDQDGDSAGDRPWTGWKFETFKARAVLVPAVAVVGILAVLGFVLSRSEDRSQYTGHTSDVGGLLELTDGLIASASGDNTVQIWDPADPGITLATYTGHTDAVWTVVELTDGRIASAGVDKTVRLWNPADPSTTVDTYTGHTDTVWTVVELTDGRIASGSGDDTVQIWDPADPSTTLATYMLHSEDVAAVVELTDGRIASGSGDHTVQIWDPNDPGRVERSYVGHSGAVWSVIELADGRIASGSWDDTVQIWDPADPGTTLATYAGHTETVMAVIELTNEGTHRLIGGDRMASASVDDTVQIWDASDP